MRRTTTGSSSTSTMAQQEQSSGVRRRNLESSMKESQARTKVVLRHLPPTLSQAVLVEYIDSKFAGCYTWFSFRPGKVSLKRQLFSRAYINFKRPEDVYDFYEDFDGHVFLNERGTQYRVSAEYAPYQRIPKPRSKKDIREGTISKDPDYLEFLESLAKPTEFLPSAEVQLERREAEKAAAIAAGGGKDSVVVTPLMEYVRQKRATKSAPQRSVSSKLGGRSTGVTVVTSNLAPHKRGLERSRSGPLMYVPENSVSTTPKDVKDVSTRDYVSSHRREEQHQRKDRETAIDRRKKEMPEVKEKKVVNELTPAVAVSSKGNIVALRLETNKDTPSIAFASKDNVEGELAAKEVWTVDSEPCSSSSPGTGKAVLTLSGSNEGMFGDIAKDPSKRDIGRKKQLTEVGPATTPPSTVGTGSNSNNQRHRPPVSPRINPSSTPPQTQLHVADESDTIMAPSKPRRETSGRNASRVLSPREHLSPAGLQQHISSHVTLLQDSQGQQSSPLSDRAGKRPPRPQNIRLIGKEQNVSLASSSESDIGSATGSTSLLAEEKTSNTPAIDSFHASDRQDPRRVRNKDRPDRPVWTPRRRSDSVQNLDASSSGASTSTTPLSHVDGADLGSVSSSKPEKTERGTHRHIGKSASNSGLNFAENKATEAYLGTGQHIDGGRSQSGSYNSPLSGKARYVESSSMRTSRSRGVPGTVLSIQEHMVVNPAEQSRDSSLSGRTLEPKGPQISLYTARENGESHGFSMADKEKRKQDATPQWTELTGGSHRYGDRRRDRNAQHGTRDGDGGGVAADLSKPIKRGGNLPLGSNEKQVWVAVQKPGSGT